MGHSRHPTQRDRELLVGHSGVTMKSRSGVPTEVRPNGGRIGGAKRILELAAPNEVGKTRRQNDDVMDLVCMGSEREILGMLTYPCTLSKEPTIMLDRVCASMYYLWFPLELAQDMVLIRIQKVCRETQQSSNGRIHIDNGCIDQGRIVIRVNLAEHDDGGRAFWRAILDISRVLCTTTKLESRGNFMSDLENEPNGGLQIETIAAKTSSDR